MAKLKILAGDWKGSCQFSFGMVSDLFDGKKFFRESREIKTASLREASEENITSLGGAAGFGLAGAVLLGPAGLIAGALLGGKKTIKVGVLEWPDGKKMLFQCDSKVWPKLMAATGSF